MADLDFNFLTVFFSMTSLVLSVSNWIYIWIKNKRNFKFEIIRSCYVDYLDNDKGIFDIEILFKNNSSSPISICYLELIDDLNQSHLCSLDVSFEKHKFNKMIDTDSWYEKFIESAKFPINLIGNQVSHEYIHVVFPKNRKVQYCYIHLNKGSKISSEEIVQKLNFCDKYCDGHLYHPKERDITTQIKL